MRNRNALFIGMLIFSAALIGCKRTEHEHQGKEHAGTGAALQEQKGAAVAQEHGGKEHAGTTP